MQQQNQNTISGIKKNPIKFNLNKSLKVKYKLSIDAWDVLISQGYYWQMNLQLEEAWTNENAENKSENWFVLEIRSLIFCMIFDPINDQIY